MRPDILITDEKFYPSNFMGKDGEYHAFFSTRLDAEKFGTWAEKLKTDMGTFTYDRREYHVSLVEQIDGRQTPPFRVGLALKNGI